jgi:hypothetical protein
MSTTKATNGVTPWVAFFSIGKSTKKKGESIGYKCQGSKLCFACSRIFVATKHEEGVATWYFKSIDNPRNNLDTSFDITPIATEDISSQISNFFTSPSAATDVAIKSLQEKLPGLKTGTLIIIDGLDTENFGKYFALGNKAEDSYVYNYLRFNTRHGDTRFITKDQGFTGSHIKQVAGNAHALKLTVLSKKKQIDVPFGYPYLSTTDQDPNVKLPSQISRLRDGRFFSRAAKTFSVSGATYSIVFAIDGNRRAHEEYKYLDRKGKAMSGIRLGDHRGPFISVKGIKICKHPDLLTSIPEYQILAEGDSPSHYILVLDGDFDVVTNRNSLSKKAFDTLNDPLFVNQIKKFLDSLRTSDKVFAELLLRLKRESSENLLNDQIETLTTSRNALKTRERFRVKTADGQTHLFISPQPGEEYLVGVLYATLGNLVPKDSPYLNYWQKIVTFSTQGIDSLALKDPASGTPLNEANIIAVEYKYEFNNSGPFNHALAVVDYIVAWNVDLNVANKIRDTFTCFGDIKDQDTKDGLEWDIHNIENDEGGQFKQVIKVVCLKKLIQKTFDTTFNTPNAQ